MSQRNTSPLSRSTVRRTLQRFWGVTRTQPLIVFLSVFSSAGYIFLLTFANTYVMALIVDRVQAGPVAGDQVFEVFGPYILALVLVNLVGQILSKLQDYTVYKLEIAGNYHLARLCFDTLSNQSMTFHTSRFGGSLVSQTSRFMSGYTGLVDVTVYSLIPTITSVICTVAALAPVVPTFTVRRYAGKPIINSVNGKQQIMDEIFPLVAHYGTNVVGLTLDEGGIPDTAEARFAIAEHIVAEAARYGIGPDRILIDCLVMTASTNQRQAEQILRAMSLCTLGIGLSLHQDRLRTLWYPGAR